MENRTIAKSPAAITALKGAAAADVLVLIFNALQTALISSGTVSTDAMEWMSALLLGLCSSVSGFVTAGRVHKARLPWAVLSGLLLAAILVLAGCVFFPDFALSRAAKVVFPALAGSAAGGVIASTVKKEK
ncbi:MAG: TIGR04086 family membrane protein [Oscillospiraceae bacterium]|nr:TIGR04086 family membrane protein [Oscillospiraceae bacterium]